MGVEEQADATLDQVVGKAQEAVGDAVGDQNLAAAGEANQLQGDAKEVLAKVQDAGQKVADSIKNAIDADGDGSIGTDDAKAGFDKAKDSVSSAADKVKASLDADGDGSVNADEVVDKVKEQGQKIADAVKGFFNSDDK